MKMRAAPAVEAKVLGEVGFGWSSPVCSLSTVLLACDGVVNVSLLWLPANALLASCVANGGSFMGMGRLG